MARQPRFIPPGTPVHIIQRGNNRAVTFRCESDFLRYRDLLHKASQRCRCAIHAYAFMPNHVHLLTTSDDEAGPSGMIQAVGRAYVRYVNSRHHRTGTLWEGRFRSSIVDTERYLLTCSRYIELNPVRARMVDVPERYRWSSYSHNAYGTSDSLVTSHRMYNALGPIPLERQEAYRALFDAPMEQPMLDQIRRATNRGKPLGDPDFCEEIEATRRSGVRSPDLTPRSDP
jgi:putative transposase